MSEHDEQAAVIQLCAYNREARKIFAIPNGTNIPSHAGRAKAKKEGLTAGVPDLFLPVPRGEFHGLFIEMKKPKSKNSKAGKPSKEQIEKLQELNDDGYMAVLCFGSVAAWNTIKEYLDIT